MPVSPVSMLDGELLPEYTTERCPPLAGYGSALSMSAFRNRSFCAVAAELALPIRWRYRPGRMEGLTVLNFCYDGACWSYS
ncbi:MAG: hypothetical protein ACWGQW_26255, partial [bacterium]